MSECQKNCKYNAVEWDKNVLLSNVLFFYIFILFFNLQFKNCSFCLFVWFFWSGELLLTLNCPKVIIDLSEKTGQGSFCPLRCGPGRYQWGQHVLNSHSADWYRNIATVFELNCSILCTVILHYVLEKHFLLIHYIYIIVQKLILLIGTSTNKQTAS